MTFGSCLEVTGASKVRVTLPPVANSLFQTIVSRYPAPHVVIAGIDKPSF